MVKIKDVSQFDIVDWTRNLRKKSSESNEIFYGHLVLLDLHLVSYNEAYQ